MADKELTQRVTDVVARYCEAIHTQDETSFRALWTGDATDTLLSQATAFVGPDAIARDFLGLLHNAYDTITLVNEGMDTHLLTSEVAIVVFRYHTECVRRGTSEPYGIAGLVTQVMRLVDGQWKLAHVQYHGTAIEG